MAQKNALGRGLGALIENHQESTGHKGGVAFSYELFINDIEPNPFNPRTHFDETALEELATSIREIGVVQPITVRAMEDGKFQIIAGERRFRASKLAGLRKIPAFVRNADDDNMLEMALVENIQREDLDPIEVGLSYSRLMDEFKLTQERLSERVGKKRATISNYMRLLKLPAEIQMGLKHRELSMGHARTLINVEDPESQLAVYKRIVAEELSVRQTEELVRKFSNSTPEKVKSEGDNLSEEYKALENQLRAAFDAKVDFKRSEKGSGKIVISFNSDADLERIISVLDKSK